VLPDRIIVETDSTTIASRVSRPKSRHDGDCDQRADDHECISDSEREDAAEDRTVVDGSVCDFLRG
jgi:hypothetical protein